MKNVFIILILLLSACSLNEEEKNEISNREANALSNIEVDNIYKTIEELEKEPRIAGDMSEKKAAVFLEEQLKGIDYKVDVQSFSYDEYINPTFTELTVEGQKDEFSPAPFKYSVSGDVAGEFIDIGEGREADYEKSDIGGKIVVIRRSELDFYELVLNAEEAGASAVVFYFDEANSHEGWSLGYYDEAYIPTLALSKEDGNKLIKLMQSGESVNGNLVIEGSRISEKESQNVIVTLKPSIEADENGGIIVVGAHYDTVENSPGASDNASGVGVLLEVARVLKEIPTEHEVRFIFFGAEEIEYLGSEKYVKEMSQKEIEETIAMFNMDMVGSEDAGPLSLFTVDGNANEATIIGSHSNKDLFGESLPVQLGDRSDHLYFHQAGIDSVLFSYYPLEKSYHSSQDTIDKISKERLKETADIVTLSILKLANSGNANK